MQKILIATKNPGKVLEYREIFAGLPFEIVTLADFDIKSEPKEDAKTFTQNALKKADFYSKLVNLPLIAEDSGLEIDYLNGKPGVLSRRWSGHEASDEELLDIVLSKLKGVPKDKRGAQLRVVVAFKASVKKAAITAEGVLRGYITEKPMAKIVPGYPFRAVFYVPELGKVLGALTMEGEAHVAHRKKAIKKLMPRIKQEILKF